MPVVVGPGMGPIPVPVANANPTGSSKVKFEVALPEMSAQAKLLVTLCIKVQIGSIVVYIYFSKVVDVNIGINPPVVFDVLLPNGSIIMDATATFDELYPEIVG